MVCAAGGVGTGCGAGVVRVCVWECAGMGWCAAGVVRWCGGVGDVGGVGPVWASAQCGCGVCEPGVWCGGAVWAGVGQMWA